MGLFGELTFLERCIESGCRPKDVIDYWKGCERGYHDFDNGGKIIEVKATQRKEPRKVWINNERQLDERGLMSLILYVVTLHTLESGAQTLPDLVKKIKDLIGSDNTAIVIFEKKLSTAGYLEIHESSYNTGYLRKKEEAFHIGNGFPRILEAPGGVGDITYSLTLSACKNFEIELETMMKEFIGDTKYG